MLNLLNLSGRISCNERIMPIDDFTRYSNQRCYRKNSYPVTVWCDNMSAGKWGEVFYQNGKMLDEYFLRKIKKQIRISYDRRVKFPNV